jgi:hypothetical protein
VHIQADVDHDEDPVAETAWVDELADDALKNGLPAPMACVVYADLRAPDLAATLSRHLHHPLTRGVRQEVWFDPASTRADIPRDDVLADPRWQEGYGTLADHGLSFDVAAWPAQLPASSASPATNALSARSATNWSTSSDPRPLHDRKQLPGRTHCRRVLGVLPTMIASRRELSESERADVLAGTTPRFYRTVCPTD